MAQNIYQIISAISEEAGALAPEKNGGVPFAFRGIDGTVAHLSPYLRKYGVVAVPTVLEHVVTARDLPGSKVITQSEVLTKFTFYAPDGSNVEVTTAGLAQDYADRSAAQAQSVAFRVALLQLFALPTHSKEPEVAGEETQKYIADAEKSAPAPKPSGPSVSVLQGKVRAFIESGSYTGDDVNTIGAKIAAGAGKKWDKTDASLLAALVAKLESGEVA